MKRLLYNIILTVLASVLAFSGPAELSKYTVGRVRFVEGDSAKFTFREKEVNVNLDYLVFLSGIFETNKSRIEIVDLNEDVFWFDNETFFNFESYDPKGERTTLFLGKGTFACKTTKPFSIITGGGSVLFPANGRYIVEKSEFGKTKTVITTLEGEKPNVINSVGVFSKFRFEVNNKNSKIYSWMLKKELDWNKTIVRTKLFSHVSIMSPYLADSKKDGKVSWIKVKYVKPLRTADTMIQGNSFYYYNADILRASGITPGLVNTFSDEQLHLFFTTNKFNAIKWVWNVERGWHAEFYYDPLTNFGADFYCSSNRLSRYLGRDDSLFFVDRGPGACGDIFYGPGSIYYNNFYGPGNCLPYGSVGSIPDMLSNVVIKSGESSTIRGQVKPIKVGIVIVTKPLVVKTRMNSDSSLVKTKDVVKLSIKDKDIERIKRRSYGSGTNRHSNTRVQIRPIRYSSSSRIVGTISTNGNRIVSVRKK